jgi:dynein regulatory complex protein 1
MLVKDGEEYNKLKIKLENDVQTLERQLEEMRATYQLNTEKLDYNYRVLTERDSENSTTLQQLKRKQNKLKDVLSRVMAKYQETDERDKNENERLTEEYKRMTKAYRDLQLKFRHFEVTDRQKFDRVWQMCGGGVRYWPSLRRRGVSESARSRRDVVDERACHRRAPSRASRRRRAGGVDAPSRCDSSYAVDAAGRARRGNTA